METPERQPVRDAARLGQSFWLDSLSRRILTNGELRGMVEVDGLAGVTSNPTIFEKAMVGTDDYKADVRRLVERGMRDAKAIYESLAIDDIRAAADLLHPTYIRHLRADGFASLEVSPHLAHSTEGTVVEARRLFHEVERENVMIKVPGTREGMPAIERLIGEGINVNVTLLFGLDAYRACAEAYLAGLERFDAAGGDLRHVTGVASFFLSRIDTVIDQRIDAALAKKPPPEAQQRLDQLRGKVAIANAKLAYEEFARMIDTPRWHALASRGAHPQRLLWASTGTKNPAYSKLMYVEPLMGPATVNTVPPETFRVFLAEGQARVTIQEGRAAAHAVMRDLAAAGIALDDVTDGLLEAGIAKFCEGFDRLLGSLDQECHALGAGGASIAP
jgi:transaldolase/glucose-6-phosphate isomerase